MSVGSETAGRRPLGVRRLSAASRARRPVSLRCRRSMNRLPATTDTALREDQDLTGVIAGLGEEDRFGRHDSAGAGGRGLHLAGAEFEVGRTAPACTARSHAEVRNLPAERGMNRIVRVQDCLKHVGYVGRQALGHPVTVSDQRFSARTMPGSSPFGLSACSRRSVWWRASPRTVTPAPSHAQRGATCRTSACSRPRPRVVGRLPGLGRAGTVRPRRMRDVRAGRVPTSDHGTVPGGHGTN